MPEANRHFTEQRLSFGWGGFQYPKPSKLWPKLWMSLCISSCAGESQQWWPSNHIENVLVYVSHTLFGHIWTYCLGIFWGSFGPWWCTLHLLWDPKRKPLAHKIFDGDLGKKWEHFVNDEIFTNMEPFLTTGFVKNRVGIRHKSSGIQPHSWVLGVLPLKNHVSHRLP